MEEGIKPFEIIDRLQEIITKAGQHTQNAPAPLGIRHEADQLIRDLSTAARGLGKRIDSKVFQLLSEFQWMMSSLVGVPSIPPSGGSLSAEDRQAMLGMAEDLKRYFHVANQKWG